MTNRLYIDRLDRITLVRKGRAVAKHPDLRGNVVEVVKASAVGAAKEMVDALVSALQGASGGDRKRILYRLCQALNVPTDHLDTTSGTWVAKGEPTFDALFDGLMLHHQVSKASPAMSRYVTGRWG